jgi:hypothetical protein
MYGIKYSLKTSISHSTGESKLEVPAGVLSTNRGLSLSYNLLPGQEVEVLTGLTDTNGFAAIALYAIEASDLLLLSTATSVAAPVNYTTPAGLVYFWCAPSPGNFASIKLKAPTSVTNPVNVDILLALN